MQKTLRVGEKLDLEFLTQAELEEVLDERLAGYLRPPQPYRDTATIPLNASGNSYVSDSSTGTAAARGVPIARAPAGYRLAVHRIAVIPEGGFTFGSPFTNSTGYLELHVGSVVEDGISFTTLGLPQVWSAGVADAIYLDNNEVLSALIFAGPTVSNAGVNVKFNIRGTIRPLIEL